MAITATTGTLIRNDLPNLRVDKDGKVPQADLDTYTRAVKEWASRMDRRGEDTALQFSDVSNRVAALESGVWEQYPNAKLTFATGLTVVNFALVRSRISTGGYVVQMQYNWTNNSGGALGLVALVNISSDWAPYNNSSFIGVNTSTFGAVAVVCFGSSTALPGFFRLTGASPQPANTETFAGTCFWTTT